MNAFKNNVVVLVGASRGIGEQLSYQLAAQGAHLVLAARSENQLYKVAEECKSYGARVKVIVTDVKDK